MVLSFQDIHWQLAIQYNDIKEYAKAAECGHKVYKAQPSNLGVAINMLPVAALGGQWEIAHDIMAGLIRDFSDDEAVMAKVRKIVKLILGFN